MARAALALLLATTVVVVPAIAYPTQSPTGSFVFGRLTAQTGTGITVRTVMPAPFAEGDRVQLFLVPRALDTRVKSAADSRISSLGSLRIGPRGVGSLRFTVPEVAPGRYVLARRCARCARRANRPFAVLRPTNQLPYAVRLHMTLQVDDVRRCSGEYSWTLLNDFFSAFRAGEPLVTRFLTREDRWIGWRDPTHVIEPVPYSELETHLQSLRQSGVTLTSESLAFNGYRSSKQISEFGFRLNRPGKEPGNGKGAVDCTTGRLALVTIDSW